MLWNQNICCAPFANLPYESQQRLSNRRLQAVINYHSKSIDVLPVSSFNFVPIVVSCHHLRWNGLLQTFNGEEKFFGRILCVSITQISSVQFFLRDCEWFLRGSSFLLFRALVAFRGRWGELHLEVELIEAFDVGAKLMFTIPSDWHVCHGTALQSLLNWWVCCGSGDPGICRRIVLSTSPGSNGAWSDNMWRRLQWSMQPPSPTSATHHPLLLWGHHTPIHTGLWGRRAYI